MWLVIHPVSLDANELCFCRGGPELALREKIRAPLVMWISFFSSSSGNVIEDKQYILLICKNILIFMLNLSYCQLGAEGGNG